MRKHILYTTLALVAIWGCAKVSEIDVIPKEENPQETPEILPEGTYVATLSCKTEQDNPDVKGTFVTSGEHLAFQWQEGDEIGVYMYGVGGGEYNPWIGPFTLDKGAGTGNGEFTRVLQNYEDFGNVAIYPYTSGSSFNYGTNTLTFNLPAKYENLDNLDMIRMPMVGVLDMSDYGAHKNTFEFKHVGGVVKFTLKDVPAKAKYFKMWTVGKRVSGNFTINLSTVGTQALQTENTDSDNNTVEMQLKQGRAVNELDVYFPVPAGTYTLGIGVYGDGITYLEKTASKENTVGRGRILKMPAITIPGRVTGAYNADLPNTSKASGITYQVNVFSFADSDGNGVGDFKGIEEHLDYFDKLGVTALWLSPCQEAQSYHGYDVTNYSALNPIYASSSTKEGRTSAKAEEDFQSLITKAHQHNIRIYMDYVINHTGDQHPWFKDAKEKGPKVGDTGSDYWEYYALSQAPWDDVPAGQIKQIPGWCDYNGSEWWPAMVGAGLEQKRYAIDLDWTNESAPTITVNEVPETTPLTTGGTHNNPARYLFWGNGTYSQFADNGENRYRLVLLYQSDWGCLVRTNSGDDWSSGTKWGFNAFERLPLNTAHTLYTGDSDDVKNILMPDGTLYYYYSAFQTGAFADLNYGWASECQNSAAFNAIVSTTDKWLGMGVDGFRLDAVKHIYNTSDDNVKFWQQFYTTVNEKYKISDNIAARSALTGTADENVFMVGEVLSGEQECITYYQGLPALFEFQFWFDLKPALNNESKGGFVSGLCDRYYAHKNEREQKTTQAGTAIPTPKLSNHDEDRTASDLGKYFPKLRLAAAVLLTSPGRPFIYQGEELGYWGTKGNGDEYVRTPILWNDNLSSAASGGDMGGLYNKVDWDMLNTPSISVAAQEADKESLLMLYRRFAYARNTNIVMAQGEPEYDNKTDSNNSVMAWYMHEKGASWNTGHTCLVMHNITSSKQEVQRWDGDNVSEETILVASDHIRVEGKTVIMPPYSSVVFALN